VAIGCVVIFLIFPETLNHQYLNSISALLATVRELVEVQDRVLRVTQPAEINPETPMTKEIQGKVAGMIGSIQKCAEFCFTQWSRRGINLGIPVDSQSGMLSLEFTFGRFNGDDAKAIEEPLKMVVSRIGLCTVCSAAPSIT